MAVWYMERRQKGHGYWTEDQKMEEKSRWQVTRIYPGLEGSWGCLQWSPASLGDPSHYQFWVRGLSHYWQVGIRGHSHHCKALRLKQTLLSELSGEDSAACAEVSLALYFGSMPHGYSWQSTCLYSSLDWFQFGQHRAEKDAQACGEPVPKKLC